MPASRSFLRFARLFHLYSGVFFTPALLFFAFTGAAQSMNFHEAARGPGYKPPYILVKLAQLHKKETLVLPERRPPAPPNPNQPKAPAPAPAQKAQKAPNTFPMKIFSFWAGVGLFLSTLTGLYMAYQYARNKIVITATLLAGLAVPLVLLAIQ